MLAFHLDEHMDHAIAHGLRGRGIDVTTTTEAGLLGADDAGHIAFGVGYFCRLSGHAEAGE